MKKILFVLISAMFCLSVVNVMAKAPKKSETVTFNVPLHCESCVKKVKENISFEKGVTDLKVSLEEHTVTVTYNPDKTSVDKIKKSIEKLGYAAEVKKNCCGHHGAEGCKGCKDGHECKGGCHGQNAECPKEAACCKEGAAKHECKGDCHKTEAEKAECHKAKADCCNKEAKKAECCK